jgi:predicted nucleic acid-binding protein
MELSEPPAWQATNSIDLPVITVLVLAHGAVRADTVERIERRQRFAPRAGRIDGRSRAGGVSIPLADLPIGVSALELGCALGGTSAISNRSRGWTSCGSETTP